MELRSRVVSPKLQEVDVQPCKLDADAPKTSGGPVTPQTPPVSKAQATGNSWVSLLMVVLVLFTDSYMNVFAVMGTIKSWLESTLPRNHQGTFLWVACLWLYGILFSVRVSLGMKAHGKLMTRLNL